MRVYDCAIIYASKKRKTTHLSHRATNSLVAFPFSVYIRQSGRRRRAHFSFAYVANLSAQKVLSEGPFVFAAQASPEKNLDSKKKRLTSFGQHVCPGYIQINPTYNEQVIMFKFSR